MRIGRILSKQKIYNKKNPLVILLSEDVHEVRSSWTSCGGTVHSNLLEVAFSNISLVGTGKKKTIIRGGIRVANKKNVTIRNLTLTNPTGNGLAVDGDKSSVEMTGVSFEKCGWSGLAARWYGMIKATRCEFVGSAYDGVIVEFGVHIFLNDCRLYQNGRCGVLVQSSSLVELHGDQTEVHNNNSHGLAVSFHGSINLFVPSRHLSSLVHDNFLKDLKVLGRSGSGKIQSQLKPKSELTVILSGNASIF
jgi:hypothetical protein